MKQVININFHGQVVPIEVSAFDILKSYTASLSRYFANEDGKEEIINDIESRIAELFQERLKKGATCITDEDVNAIIKSMGRPEEFEGDDSTASAKTEQQNDNSQSASSQQSSTNAGHSKRLFRTENDKVVGGVCGGLANYFGLDPVVVRIIFVVVALAFGTGILAYLILWLAVPSSASVEIGSTRKKLFRDPDEKIIGGVGSGIGNYFGVNPWIPRILFLLPFISLAFDRHDWGFWNFSDFLRVGFSPGSLMVYIILWLVIPEATNTAEKLEMKGEKVDLNSIKNSVMEEMKGVQQRAEKFGQEAKTFAEQKGKTMSSDIGSVAKRGSRSIGDIIVLIVKAFGYFIIGCVGFAAVAALFSLAIFSIGIFPLKYFVLTDGWQDALAWGTLIFFIAVPVIGIITWIIRRLAKMRSNGKVLRFAFISLWIVGWFCVVSLIASVSKDFRTSNTIAEEEVMLVNPKMDKLELTSNSPLKKYYRNNWFRLGAFETVEDDTAFVQNIEIKIIKSPTDSFRVTMMKRVCGRDRRSADTLARLIQFNAQQSDSLLILDKGIPITRNNKFRNQQIIMTVYVPVGKKIRIDRSVGWGNNVHFGGPWSDGIDVNFDDEERGWDTNTDYIMKADGLYDLEDDSPADEWKHDNDKKETKVKVGTNGIEVRDSNTKVTIDKNGVQVMEKGDDYRYNQTTNRIDSMKQQLQLEKQRTQDSLKKEKEKIDKQLEKISDDKNNPAASNLRLQSYSLLINI